MSDELHVQGVGALVHGMEHGPCLAFPNLCIAI